MQGSLVKPSIQNGPNDNTAAYGSGQYLTDLPPNVAATQTKYVMSYALYKLPYNWRRVLYDVAVDVSGLPVGRVSSIYTSAQNPKYSPSYGIYLNPSTAPLPVAGRIVLAQSGLVAYAGG